MTQQRGSHHSYSGTQADGWPPPGILRTLLWRTGEYGNVQTKKSGSPFLGKIKSYGCPKLQRSGKAMCLETERGRWNICRRTSAWLPPHVVLLWIHLSMKLPKTLTINWDGIFLPCSLRLWKKNKSWFVVGGRKTNLTSLPQVSFTFKWTRKNEYSFSF